MLLSFLTLAILSAAQAAPAPILPADGAKACYGREYSAKHMLANPKQNVAKLHVLLERPAKPAEWDPEGEFTSVKVVGEKDGVYYGNEASCQLKENGRVFCFIECDGGSFDLKHGKPGRVNFEITRDYYFPLYKNGSYSEEGGRPEDALDFRSDRDNGVYSLEKKEVRACEQQWKNYKNSNFGC